MMYVRTAYIVQGAALAILLSLAPAAHAQVTVLEDRVDWYDIRGTSLSELRRSMDQNTTAGEFDAQAKWFVNWRYRWVETDKECRLTSDDVSLRIVITFPRLSTRQGMSDKVQKAWDDYARKLMAHERQHARHGADAADEIDRLFDNFSVPGGCDSMQEAANAAASAIIRKANDLDTNYDETTDHGRNEGVVLE